MNNNEMTIKEYWEKVYVTRILRFADINMSGSTIGSPKVEEYEIFKEGPKKFTYVPLERPNEYYYTISHVQSDPAVIDENCMYTLKDVIQGKTDIECAHKLAKQIKHFHKYVEKEKSRV